MVNEQSWEFHWAHHVEDKVTVLALSSKGAISHAWIRSGLGNWTWSSSHNRTLRTFPDWSPVPESSNDGNYFRSKRTSESLASSWHVEALVVADETMTAYYDEDQDLILYILTLMNNIELFSAELGSICKKGKSCTINQDNGLTVSHTIAHEIAHTLGIPHDDPTDPGCTENAGHFVMSPSLETDIRRLSWSECSRRSLTNFLGRSNVECLKNASADSIQATMEPTPTGTLFDAHHQCRLKFGRSDSKLCPLFSDRSEFCRILWCEVDGKCLTLGDPPEAGTLCGDHQWCQLGQCVPIEDDHLVQTIHGQWGHWGEWGACSRDCGAGFELASRQCDNPEPRNGGKYCLGEHDRKRVCLTGRDCEGGLMEDLDAQCQSDNPGPNSVRAIRNPKNFCQIQCVQINGDNSPSSNYHYLFAADGTACGHELGSRHMCLDGKCAQVGCDWILGSDSAQDACGICNGNGTQCRRISGFLDADTQETRGYEYVATVPSGAQLLAIMERDASSNFIALMDTDNSFPILNWNYRVQWPGLYTLGRLSLNYSRIPHNSSHHVRQSAHLHEPLSSPIDVYLLRQGHSPGLDWSFVLPFKNASQFQATAYQWVTGSWGPCDLTCGAGNQFAEAECREVPSHRSVPRDLCLGLPRPRALTRPCSVQSCPPSWWMGPWQDCLASSCELDNGTQYRSVLCVQGGEKALPDEACLYLSRPIDRRECTKNCTEMKTDNGNNGTEEEAEEDDIIFLPSSSLFSGSNATNMTFQDQHHSSHSLDPNQPTLEDSHQSTDQAIQDSRWVASVWVGTCKCQFAIQLRQLSCPAGLECHSLKKPKSIQFCHFVAPCQNWTVSTWSTCSQSCGGEFQHRNVSCPMVVANGCDLMERPLSSRNCHHPACHYWSVGPWSACSASCGWGLVSRSVVCRHFLTQTEDASGCSQINQPVSQKECISAQCIESHSPLSSQQGPAEALNPPEACQDELGANICLRFRHLCGNHFYLDKCCQTCQTQLTRRDYD
eukprot:maker-scaffold295_size218279-snap-gene-1.25 protein:Tk09094 transcript:maker-scaffold295_size218279-snap-gene-1.25-mRNA-1 annotation:"a disintegrin and metalloproteinase with thrombospondin motifs 7 isoform x2"